MFEGVEHMLIYDDYAAEIAMKHWARNRAPWPPTHAVTISYGQTSGSIAAFNRKIASVTGEVVNLTVNMIDRHIFGQRHCRFLEERSRQDACFEDPRPEFFFVAEAKSRFRSDVPMHTHGILKCDRSLITDYAAVDGLTNPWCTLAEFGALIDDNPDAPIVRELFAELQGRTSNQFLELFGGRADAIGWPPVFFDFVESDHFADELAKRIRQKFDLEANVMIDLITHDPWKAVSYVTKDVYSNADLIFTRENYRPK